MHVFVNGDERRLTKNATVADLLGQLQLSADQVAVEVNLRILERSEFDHSALQEGDRVEILSFIGGGN